jgi:phosphatidylglycerophosphatase C
MQKTLVLFDFDGTITKRDTFPLFFRFTFGYFKFVTGFGLHIPLFICFKLGLISAEKFNKSILSFYLKNKQEIWLKNKGKAFFEFLSSTGNIKPEFVTKIQEYQKNNATVAIVSASIDAWLKPFCEEQDVLCICTELDYTNGLFIGNLKTKNCNRKEKESRIKSAFDLKNFNKIIAFGNSSGDAEMFSLAHEQIWVK